MKTLSDFLVYVLFNLILGLIGVGSVMQAWLFLSKDKPEKSAGSNSPLTIIIGVVVFSFFIKNMLTFYSFYMGNYKFFSALRPEDVTEVGIGIIKWNKQEDIQTITTALNHPIFFYNDKVLCRTGCKSMVITLQSKKKVSFEITTWDNETLVRCNVHSNIYSSMPKLANVLKRLGYSLR